MTKQWWSECMLLKALRASHYWQIYEKENWKLNWKLKTFNLSKWKKIIYGTLDSIKVNALLWRGESPEGQAPLKEDGS